MFGHRPKIALLALTLLTSTEAVAVPLEAESVLITLIEQVDVPAKELGVLDRVSVSEGQTVDEGAPLAQIDDEDIQVAKRRASQELGIARMQAENDVNVRYAKKSLGVAQAELQRALESAKRYPKSVSESELDRLQLRVQRASLEIEQAQHEMAIAKATRDLKRTELERVDAQLRRRQVLAPVGGVVVQVNRRRGEWVEPGDRIARILRLDRLRAEGFLYVDEVRTELTGCVAELTVRLPGRPRAKFSGNVVFVSPEVDPVNRQVRIWAEFANPRFALRPGLQGRMTIHVKDGKKE